KLEKVRRKIITNGFKYNELFSLRHNFKNIKKTLHPNLTKDLTLIDVIYDSAKDALSLWFPAVAFFAFILGILLERGAAFFFMSAVFSIFSVMILCSDAKNNNVKIITQLKLIKLGIRILF
ncbi:TPA: hypothetical protein ACIELY_004663, partial [Escherichia coli]